jgi:hypothetical protein
VARPFFEEAGHSFIGDNSVILSSENKNVRKKLQISLISRNFAE